MNSERILREAGLFSELEDQEIAALAQMGKERQCKAGEVLFSAGTPSDAFYVIGDGRLEMGVEDGGQWVHYYWLGRGEAAGIVSFFGRSPHRATARAAQDTVLLEVGTDALAQLTQMPEMLVSLFRERTQRMRRLVEKTEKVSSLPPQELRQRVDLLRRLLEELEDQSTALHTEIHMVQIKLQLYEAQLARQPE